MAVSPHVTVWLDLLGDASLKAALVLALAAGASLLLRRALGGLAPSGVGAGRRRRPRVAPAFVRPAGLAHAARVPPAPLGANPGRSRAGRRSDHGAYSLCANRDRSPRRPGLRAARARDAGAFAESTAPAPLPRRPALPALGLRRPPGAATVFHREGARLADDGAVVATRERGMAGAARGNRRRVSDSPRPSAPQPGGGRADGVGMDAADDSAAGECGDVDARAQAAGLAARAGAREAGRLPAPIAGPPGLRALLV